jgi:hypothetical protein
MEITFPYISIPNLSLFPLSSDNLHKSTNHSDAFSFVSGLRFKSKMTLSQGPTALHPLSMAQSSHA